MKKYVVEGSFGFDHLELIDAPAPEPGSGQVVVRVNESGGKPRALQSASRRNFKPQTPNHKPLLPLVSWWFSFSSLPLILSPSIANASRYYR